MIYLEYCKECPQDGDRYIYSQPICISDFEIDNFSERIQNVIKFNSDKDVIIPCSNELPFLIVRKLIAKDIISNESVSFIYNGKKIKLNQYGSMLESRIPNVISDLTQEVLEMAANKYKKNKNFVTETPLMV